MNEAFYLGACALLVCSLLYWCRQVRKRLDQANIPIIPKTPAGIDPDNDAMCISLKDRTIFTSRGVTVIATRKHRDT